MQDPEVIPFSRAGMFARVYWTCCGDPVLLLLLVVMVVTQPKLPSLLDAAFFIAVASLILVRYVDIRFLHGHTGDGKPATLNHWRKYALLVCALGLGGWVLVRVLMHFIK